MLLIIDTDPGIDDAIAILIALAAPNAQIAALTTTGGNIPRARATRNALALLQAANRPDIPVAQGAARPLTGRYHPSVQFHGPGGLSVRLPNPKTAPLTQPATDLIAQTLTAHPNHTTIIALGPLTNLSRLETKHPGILAQAAQIIIMGGAVNTPGNVTPHAEFNIHSDPHAAAHILESGHPATLSDLAASRQVALTRHQTAQLTAHTPLGRLALKILQNWFAQDPQRQRFEFYDPLAVALALDPAIAQTRPTTLKTQTAPGETYAQTTQTAQPGPISLAHKINVPRFFNLLAELLGWRTP